MRHRHADAGLAPIDSGGHWCGGATITPKSTPRKPSQVEVYFEEPANGKPGPAYAFRGEAYGEHGYDYGRWPIEFEADYRERYRPDTQPIANEQCDSAPDDAESEPKAGPDGDGANPA